jgi:hypothetical protein
LLNVDLLERRSQMQDKSSKWVTFSPVPPDSGTGAQRPSERGA